MADNILTKSRTDADIDIAAKEIGGVLHPRNILTDPAGNDVSPASETMLAQVLAALATLNSATYPEDTALADGARGMLILGQRRDADTTAVSNDGDTATLKTDEAGRLKVSTQPASYTLGAGSITANAQTVFLNVDRASNVVITMVATTLVGHNATFEYSHNSTNGTDGNWYVVQVVRSNANTVETATGVLATTPVYGWEASVNAYKWIRIRATAHTSGTAAYTITPGAYATEPVPACQVTATQPVSGTVTATPVTATSTILSSAATTNATILKGSAGNLFLVTASNNGAADAFIKLHNSTTVVPGTTPVAMWRKIPAGGSAEINGGTLGLRFGTGICMSITAGIADADVVAVAAGQVKVITSVS